MVKDLIVLLEAAGLHHRHTEARWLAGGDAGDGGEVGGAGTLHLVGSKVTTVVVVYLVGWDGVRLHLKVMPQMSNMYVISSGK